MKSGENFTGPRPGYYYGTMDGISGYYPDDHAPVSSRKRGPDAVGLSSSQSAKASKAETANRGAQGGGLALLEELEGQGRGGSGGASGGMGAALTLDDPKSVQKVLKSLVKKYNKNMEDRLKYVDAPEKFYESEMELMVLIEGMKGGTESASLYDGLLLDARYGVDGHDDHNSSGEVVAVIMGLLQVG